MAVRIYRNGQWNNITAPVAAEDANRIAIGATDETIDPSKIYYPSFVDVNNPSNARDYEPLYTGAGITFTPGGVGSHGGGDLAICGSFHLKGTSGSHDGDIWSAGGSDGKFGIYNAGSSFLALSVLDANGTYLGISTFMVQDGNDNPGRKSYFDSNVSPVYHNCYNLGESSAHQWNNVYANKFYGDGSNLTCVGGATAWQPDAQENLYAGTLAGNAFDADTCCNIAVGYHAGCSTQSTGSNADNNIFLGSRSGANNTIGGNNVFLGQCAGYCNTNGVGGNVAIGRRALFNNTSANNNVAIGCRAGYNLNGATSSNNVFLGKLAGCGLTSGCRNVAIGNRAQLECLTGSDQLVIGNQLNNYWLRGDCDNNVQLGAGLKDCDSCLGTSGQFLSSTGSHLKWQTVVATSCQACKILTVDRPITCSSDHFPTFVDSNNSTAAFESLYTNPQIRYNPNTCTICVHNLYAHKCVTVSCVLCSNGNTILGDASTDNVTFNAKVGSSILPTSCACSDSDPLGKDLGSTSFLWRNIYAQKFVGQITGNADSATCVTLTANNSLTAYRVPFASADTGTVSLYSDAGITYKPAANMLELTKIKPVQILDASSCTGTANYVIKADGTSGWSWGLVDSSSIGTLNFTDLDDTPGNYTSSANKLVAVNSAANALEFISASTVGTDTFVTGASFGSITGGARLTLTRNNSQPNITADLTISTLGGVEQFTDLTDTPNSYSGDADKIVVVNGSANGLTFANPSTVGAQKFTDLTDTPSSIANPGDDGKIVKVSAGNLVFDTVSGLGGVTDVTVVQTGRSAPCALPITVTEPSTGTKQINIPSSSNAFGARFVQNSSPSNPCDGDIWFDTSTTGGSLGNRIIQGNTKAEVNDTGTNGHFLVETEGTEQLRITHDGKIQIPDNVELQLGTGGATGNGDLRIFSNGSEQIIWDNGDGGLVLQTASSPIELRAIDQHGAGNNEIMLKANVGGTVDLYEDSTLRFQTTTNGVRIYGGLQDKDGDLGTSGQVLSSTGSELNWVDGGALPKTVTARLAPNGFATSNSSYQTALTATITPTQSNSSILVIISGSGRGAYQGNSSGQQATGYATIYKNNAPWTGIETFLQKGNTTFRTPISQAILDNAAHGGNAVSYSIMLRRNTGGVNVSISAATSITLMEVTP